MGACTKNHPASVLVHSADMFEAEIQTSGKRSSTGFSWFESFMATGMFDATNGYRIDEREINKTLPKFPP